MNNKLMIGAVAGCVSVAAIAALNKRDGEPKPSIWEKMTKGMEEMPEDFPPRMMFDNLEATKANTERILALIETDERQTEDIDAKASS